MCIFNSENLFVRDEIKWNEGEFKEPLNVQCATSLINDITCCWSDRAERNVQESLVTLEALGRKTL